jgi:hypothetical protein
LKGWSQKSQCLKRARLSLARHQGAMEAYSPPLPRSAIRVRGERLGLASPCQMSVRRPRQIGSGSLRCTAPQRGRAKAVGKSAVDLRLAETVLQREARGPLASPCWRSARDASSTQVSRSPPAPIGCARRRAMRYCEIADIPRTICEHQIVRRIRVQGATLPAGLSAARTSSR